MVLMWPPAQAIDHLEQALGLSRADLARALEADLRTLQRWHAGETYPQREARQRFAALLSIPEHLRQTFNTAEASRDLLRVESHVLGGMRPIDALGGSIGSRLRSKRLPPVSSSSVCTGEG
ncbi:MAG: hypothetical protein ACR2PL_07550 [Dehalococcoidia bacterium]